MFLNNYKISLTFLEPLTKLFLIKSKKDKYKVAQRVLSSKKKTSYENAIKVVKQS